MPMDSITTKQVMHGNDRFGGRLSRPSAGIEGYALDEARHGLSHDGGRA